jgi:hypothetical protein
MRPSTRKIAQKIFFSKKPPELILLRSAQVRASCEKRERTCTHAEVEADQLIAGVGAYAYNKQARENHA